MIIKFGTERPTGNTYPWESLCLIRMPVVHIQLAPSTCPSAIHVTCPNTPETSWRLRRKYILLESWKKRQNESKINKQANKKHKKARFFFFIYFFTAIHSNPLCNSIYLKRTHNNNNNRIQRFKISCSIKQGFCHYNSYRWSCLIKTNNKKKKKA